MIPLWCYMRLFRVERVREADKGKNKGKKTGQNEITPGGGMLFYISNELSVK